jgi:hypothetical protein
MYTTNLLKTAKLLSVLSLFFLITSCDKNDDQSATEPKITYGGFVNVGNGKARSFISKNADGSVKEVGFNFTEDALSGLPEQNTAFVLPMPADNKTQITHISFDYAFHGHGPEHIYDVPHFDVHYYMISEQEKNSITLTDPKIDILPPASSIPKNYIPGPNEAKMGKHWVDSTSHEFHGKDFTTTFVYGSYNGKFTFLEPMISVNYLKTKPNVMLGVTSLASVQQTGLYPQQYAILWEKERREYTVSLNNLTLRQQ